VPSAKPIMYNARTHLAQTGKATHLAHRRTHTRPSYTPWFGPKSRVKLSYSEHCRALSHVHVSVIMTG
jgi:hypothetical protein